MSERGKLGEKKRARARGDKLKIEEKITRKWRGGKTAEKKGESKEGNEIYEEKERKGKPETERTDRQADREKKKTERVKNKNKIKNRNKIK